jgi:type IV secretory pathway TraG/TraD family ATPase VirD4
MAVPFKTLNMFDKRGVAWDMAKDITNSTQAEAMAEILMPKNERASQPYFDDAARSFLKGVLCTFIDKKPGRWTFRDVIFTLRSRSRLVQVLRQTPDGRELLELYFSKDTVLDVLSTIANKTDPYKAIAAAWARAEEKISLADWVEDEYVLVLGNSHVARPAMRAINQVIFMRVSQLLLEQPNNTHRRTWIFLDELRQAGKLDGLDSLAVEGRSRGVSLVLGTQDVEGIHAVWGKEQGEELLGLAAINAFLRTKSAKTAQWASEQIGEQEKFEYGTNVTALIDGLGDESETTTEQLVKRETVLPSQIMDLPVTDRVHGLTAYFLAPGVGVWKATLSPKFLAENLAPPDRSVPDTVQRPSEELHLEPWSEEEMKELGLTPAQEPEQEEDQEQELDEPKQENKGPKPAPLKTLRPKPNREPELPVQ